MTYRRPPTPTRLRLAARTDSGPVRHINEDGFLISDLESRARIHIHQDSVILSLGNTRGYALAVFDGMGGCYGGEVATAVAAEVMHAVLTGGQPTTEQDHRERLVVAMNGASRAIIEKIERERNLIGTATVVVAALLIGDRLHLANIGDTRGYLLRSGRLASLTRDDSLHNAAVAAGMPPEQIAELPKNIVTAALGLRESVDVRIETFPLCAGDTLLFCSDGLYNEVDEPTIERVLGDLTDPAEAVTALFNMAVRHGGNDNITLLVARPEGELRVPGPEDVVEDRNKL